jgi:hypothetical protein
MLISIVIWYKRISFKSRDKVKFLLALKI